MSKIRIFSKKAFSIGPGASRDGTVDEFITVPLAIQEIDDKYVSDPTFQLALKAGDIQIMAKPIEVPVNIPVENKREKKDPVKEFYYSLKGKNSTEIRELAREYGAEFVEGDKLSINKKRVLEAYKLTITEAEESDEEVKE